MEITMRMIGRTALAALCGLMICGAAQADTVPPFQGNDTGGIISHGLVSQTDIRAMAIAHCAQYGKVVKFLAADNTYGGYISFACRWVPHGRLDHPLRVRY
jgi:hypothetical protein